MNTYGRVVLLALDTPGTLADLRERTGFSTKYVLEGIGEARREGYPIVARGRKSEPTFFERADDPR